MAGAELEGRAKRDCQAETGCQRDNLLLLSRAAPHLAAALEDVPDFLHGTVASGARHPTRRQTEMCGTAAGEGAEDAHLRTIGCERVSFDRQLPGGGAPFLGVISYGRK